MDPITFTMLPVLLLVGAVPLGVRLLLRRRYKAAAVCVVVGACSVGGSYLMLRSLRAANAQGAKQAEEAQQVKLPEEARAIIDELEREWEKLPHPRPFG